MTEFQRQMVSVACAVVDALENLDQRLLCLENGEDRYPRQDAVWESIELGAKTLKTLNEHLDSQEEPVRTPISKLYEFNYCPECPWMERKWGDGPADCDHPDAPEPPHDPNKGNIDGIDTPPDWCPLREQPMIVRLVVKP